MHELGLVAAGVNQAIEVARETGCESIRRLTFALRPGSHISPETVRTLVEAVSRGTAAEGAAVEVESVCDSLDSAELVLTSVDVMVADGVVD